ncbi:MAG: c-type cytochrome [Gemmatales bacterium]
MNLHQTRPWLLVGLLAVGCDMPGKPNPKDRPVPSDQVLDFNLLYGKRCAGCHGADGKLGPAPPLNDAMFLAIVPDAELHKVISEGRMVTPGVRSPMPAFAQSNGGPLTAAQVHALAEGIKKKWETSKVPVSGIPPYLAKPVAPEMKGPPPTVAPMPNRTDNEQPAKPNLDAKDAQLKIFVQACASCHGNQGQGGKTGTRTVGAINDKAFLELISDQALRRIIITGRPDLGMPAFDGKTGRPSDYQPLTSAQINDLVKLLASWRKAEPGKSK